MYYVYILANRHRTIYVGMTNDLRQRVYEHKQRRVPGFTSRHGIDRLVHFEAGGDVLGVIGREKQIKGWRRSRKIALIEQDNPEWRDLSDDWD
jgi:putative endonuclease